MARCSIEGCEDHATVRGWCHRHYQRWREHGDPQAPVKERPLSKATGPCTVEGCERPLLAKGLCRLHYDRMRNSGRVDLESAMERLLKRRVVDPATGCWLLDGRRGRDQLIIVRDDEGKAGQPARASYKAMRGPIPDGMFVCHRCDEPCCFNPDHLFLGSAADNSADMVTKGRSARGSKQHNAKLTEDQVYAIRRDPRGCRRLARAYGVSPSLILLIRKRRIWKHVP